MMLRNRRRIISSCDGKRAFDRLHTTEMAEWGERD